MAAVSRQLQLAESYLADVAKAEDQIEARVEFASLRANEVRRVLGGDWKLAKTAIEAAAAGGEDVSSHLAMLHFRAGNLWFMAAKGTIVNKREGRSILAEFAAAFEASIAAEWTPEAGYNLGLAYWNLDKKQEALAALRRVAQSDTDISIDAQKEIGRIESEKSGGCYIATACYGSYDHPDVVTLRSFRDERLLRSPLGRALVACYYRIGPWLATRVGGVKSLSSAVRRLILEPVVRRLRRQ
ncbi:MAG: hypothetical protein HYU66_03555 [Armatimonadetes bacterium]|nr:hypothetical protein [Armatimonadota bacterium]